MGINQSDDKAAKKDGIWNGNQTVWRAWEPECDRYLWSLGVFAEASEVGPKDQLLSCSGCIVAKYCSVRPPIDY
jgi:hypothetical protein